MTTSTIDVKTPEGICQTRIITPDGQGPWPAVIFCFDAGGQRPSMDAMAERIAKGGYLVAIPDLFYRAGSIGKLLPPGTPVTMKSMMSVFGDTELRNRFMAEYYGPATNDENLRKDIGALLDVLAKRSDVRGGVGTTGYCMGGNVSLRLATIFGDRITAAASFHGGGLATPAPDSPHLSAAKIKAKVYVAGAIEDANFNDDMKKMLIDAFAAAKVDSTVETYPARHGFAVSDNPAFDAAAAERHYTSLEKFFAANLKKA